MPRAGHQDARALLYCTNTRQRRKFLPIVQDFDHAFIHENPGDMGASHEGILCWLLHNFDFCSTKSASVRNDKPKNNSNQRSLSERRVIQPSCRWKEKNIEDFQQPPHRARTVSHTTKLRPFCDWHVGYFKGSVTASSQYPTLWIVAKSLPLLTTFTPLDGSQRAWSPRQAGRSVLLWDPTATPRSWDEEIQKETSGRKLFTTRAQYPHTTQTLRSDSMCKSQPNNPNPNPNPPHESVAPTTAFEGSKLQFQVPSAHCLFSPARLNELAALFIGKGKGGSGVIVV
jgi:hypothetical protein